MWIPTVGDSARKVIAAIRSTECPTIRFRCQAAHGAWSGGRLSASSSSSDATALPNVAPASGPVAAIDGDSGDGMGLQPLQSAMASGCRADFDHPVTNATPTITPSANAVGAQVRRIQVSNVERHQHRSVQRAG